MCARVADTSPCHSSALAFKLSFCEASETEELKKRADLVIVHLGVVVELECAVAIVLVAGVALVRQVAAAVADHNAKAEHVALVQVIHVVKRLVLARSAKQPAMATKQQGHRQPAQEKSDRTDNKTSRSRSRATVERLLTN